MKKVFFFLALAGTTFVTSCNSDDDNGTVTPVYPDTPAATSIVLTSSASTVEVGGSFTFTVTDDLNANVTSTSQFFVDGATTALASNVFTPTAAGTYSVVAKTGTLTSAAVSVAVTAATVTPNNSVVVNNVSYVTDEALLYYLGTTEGNLNVWAVNPYDEVGSGETATYPNDLYFYITSPQVGTTNLDIPTVGSYAKGVVTVANNLFDLELIIDDQDFAVFEDVNTINFAITAIAASEAAQTISFNYNSTLTDGTSLSGAFSGDWGFNDASGSRPAAAGKSAKKVSRLSNSQIKQNAVKLLVAKK